MNTFFIIIIIFIFLFTLNSIFGFFSKKDKHRIVAFFKAYIYEHCINSSENDLSIRAIKMYNGKLSNMFIKDPSLKIIFDSFKNSGIENLKSFVLTYEDLFIFKKNKDEIKENENNRNKLISDFYEKLDMSRYE